jgi:hypothetical protein
MKERNRDGQYGRERSKQTTKEIMREREKENCKREKKGNIAVRLRFVVVRNPGILKTFGLSSELYLLRRLTCTVTA